MNIVALSRLIKVISLGLLALQGGVARMTCQQGTVQGIDFTCGNIPEPFEPCKNLNFQLSAGRSDRSTMVWILGVLHYQEGIFAKCVEEITASSPKHIIYVEGREKGETTNCENTGLKNKKGRKCVGFDDMQAHKEVNNFPHYKALRSEHETHVFLNKFNQVYQGQKKTDQDFYNYLVNKKREYMLLLKYDKAEFDKRLGQSAVAAIDRLMNEFDNSNKQISFREVFLKVGKTPEFLNSSKIKGPSILQEKQLHHKRNKSLIDILATHPNDTVAVVGIGKNHVVKQDDVDIYDSEYIRSEMNKGPHQNRYAILALRN